MTTTASDPHIAPYQPAAAPALRAADQGVADALESVLSDNTRRAIGSIPAGNLQASASVHSSGDASSAAPDIRALAAGIVSPPLPVSNSRSSTTRNWRSSSPRGTFSLRPLHMSKTGRKQPA